MNTAVIDSPIGTLTLVVSAGLLVAIRFDNDASKPDAGDSHAHEPNTGGRSESHDAVLTRTKRQLDEYFAGERTEFDLPLPRIGTGFQERAWGLLRQIPYGRTRSYGDLARELGDAKAVRAVGAANGRNPLPVVVPCHRVIGANGSLTGYAGGLPRKRFLLELEKPATTARLF